MTKRRCPIAHPHYHALSSLRKWGGTAEDYETYLKIHSWFDASKGVVPDHRHRALRHHAMGIYTSEEVFGPTIVLSTGRTVPTRYIGEQHCREDFGGRIPTLQEWLDEMRLAPWMGKEASRLSEVYDSVSVEELITA